MRLVTCGLLLRGNDDRFNRTVRTFLAEPGRHMLPDPGATDGDSCLAIKLYQDPGCYIKANGGELALWMHLAEMLRYVDQLEEKVGAFSGLKKNGVQVYFSI